MFQKGFSLLLIMKTFDICKFLPDNIVGIDGNPCERSPPLLLFNSGITYKRKTSAKSYLHRLVVKQKSM